MLAAMLSLPLTTVVKADCVPLDLSLDTLSPGVVRIAVAENTSYEHIDTVTEQKLLDTLRDLYPRNDNVVITRIDSVFRADGNFGWGDDSVVIAIDTVLKGAPTFRTMNFRHQKWEDSRNFDDLIDSFFIAFFDSDSIPPFLGLGVPSYCSDTWGAFGATGFYVGSGQIAHKGYGALLGVAIPLTDFLQSTPTSAKFEGAQVKKFGKKPRTYVIQRGMRKAGSAVFDMRGRIEPHGRRGPHFMVLPRQSPHPFQHHPVLFSMRYQRSIGLSNFCSEGFGRNELEVGYFVEGRRKISNLESETRKVYLSHFSIND